MSAAHDLNGPTDTAMFRVPNKKHHRTEAQDGEDPEVRWAEENAVAIVERRASIDVMGGPFYRSSGTQDRLSRPRRLESAPPGHHPSAAEGHEQQSRTV
jgi:hypothetical protein